MKYLTEQQMKKLNTKRLLAYKKKNLSTPLHPKCQNAGCNFICESCDNHLNANEYESVYYTIKEILSKREHIDAKIPALHSCK